jgi:pSer/pThr/pTyr-binding forkhead associated (FHA) protein
MPPQLVALSEGASIQLDKAILLVGRHQECDIQIPSRKISRRHCCIAQVNDHLVVRDLCSTNGIRINGVRVSEGRLNHGDELTIANYRYEVRLAEPRPAKPVAVDLESSEEPVALADSGRIVARGVPAAPPPDKPLPSVIIPEDLSLQAGSGDLKPPDHPSAPANSGSTP